MSFSRKTRTLLTIDRYAGSPVCFVLTLLRRARGVFTSRAAVPPPRAILFVKLAEQGSTVLAHEAIRTAAARVGHESVFFLVFEENRFVVDVLGLIPEANVLTVRTRSAGAMIASTLRILAQVRRRRIDTCVDMEFFARSSAIIAYLTGARRRIGFHTYFREGPYRGDLMTHRVLYNPHMHASRTFTSLVKAIDVDPAGLPTFPFTPPPASAPPLFQPGQAERDEVRRRIAGLGVGPPARIVLLNANASDLLPLRRWESANYVALARRLLSEFPELCVAFTGAPDEAPAVEKLVAQVGSPRCVCFAGRTTLRELLIVYGLSEVLVTNDSGPAHFASLTEIDVVTLFGPETPLLFGVPGSRSHPLWAGLACSPCVNAYNNRQTACRNNVCMKSLSVDQVFALTSDVYRKRTPAIATIP